MDACTKNIVCLGEFCSCGDIELSINGLPLGDYTVFTKFNGIVIKQSVAVTEIGKIVIKNVFNENYVHLLCFVDNNDNIFNDTWYSITVKPCVTYAL